jgi:large subunit ribosomal protein L28
LTNSNFEVYLSNYGDYTMFKKCYICNKEKTTGKKVVRKGLSKSKGGTGEKVVRTTKRTFLPNLQRIRIMDGNSPKRIYICTKCLKTGKYQKI